MMHSLLAVKVWLGRGGFEAAHLLSKTVFLISPKSIDFNGKEFNCREGSVRNELGLMVGIVANWLCWHVPPFSHCGMARLLGT